MESLKNRSDFLKVTREGQKWVTPAFVLHVFFDSRNKTTDSPPEIGFTVSKKAVNKRAVLRNRAKRRLREALRMIIGDYMLENAYIVIVARKEAVEYPFEQLQKDMRWALKRLNIRKNDVKPAEKPVAALSFGQKICIALIRLYKIILSPIAGNQCRYTPTCSEYAKQAIIRFGVLRGMWLGTKRIFRCAPWGGCGKDPIPDAFYLFSKPSSSGSVRHNPKTTNNNNKIK